MDKQKELSKKALSVEQRRTEGESLHERASDLMAKAQTKMEEATRKDELLKQREQRTKEAEDRINNSIEAQKQGKIEYDQAKDSYELIKKDIDPKIASLGEKEKLNKEKEQSIIDREKAIEANQIENKAMLEYISNQKSLLEKREWKVKEQETDLRTKEIKIGMTK